MKTLFLAIVLTGLTVALAPESVSAQEAAPTFTLDPADVSKAVVLMYKEPGSTTLLEVTFGKEKQAELAALATSSGGKPVRIILNGKEVADPVLTPGGTGHSIKIPYASADEAYAVARILLAPLAPPAPAPTAPSS